MGSLKCPFCCEETFQTKEQLLDHVVNISKNMICQLCGEKFVSITDFISHLESNCTEEDIDSNENRETTVKEELILEGIREKDSCPDDTIAENEKPVEEYAVIINGDCTNKEIKLENIGEKESEMYSCSSCGVSFTSFVEHIKEYHEGQEIIIETNEEIDEDSEEISQVFQNGAIIIEDPEFHQESDDTNDGTSISHLVDSEDRYIDIEKLEDLEKGLDARKKNQQAQPRTRQAIIQQYVRVGERYVKIQELKDDTVSKNNIFDIIQCSNCETQFPKLELYDAHSCDHEPSDYKCSYCEASFNTTRALCAHMKVHRNAKKIAAAAAAANNAQRSVGPFICLVCDTVFNNNKSLRLHRRMHLPVREQKAEAPVDYGLTDTAGKSDSTGAAVDGIVEQFECPICNTVFDKRYEQAHMEYHASTTQYDCTICNRKFHTEENLIMHFSVHNTDKGFMCTFCKKSFDDAEVFENHVKEHCQSRQYKCKHCDRSFVRPHEKVKHERIHTGEKPHVCQICGKGFRVSYCLTLHMRTHSGVRPYMCSQCGKRFKAHSVYNHHLLTHSEQRNYKCPYCPKAFKTGVQLAGHKNSHTKPFSCPVCSRPFASLYAVRCHMETHKRDNTLKHRCHLCGASYARAFAVRDHIREFHGEATTDIQDLLVVQEDAGSNGDTIMSETVLEDLD